MNKNKRKEDKEKSKRIQNNEEELDLIKKSRIK